MKIAFLILAHADPKQLEKMVDALTYEGNSFFIHIPKQVDIKPFQEQLNGKLDIYFAQQRYFTNWGGISQIYAKIAIMDLAFRTGTFDRYVFLSGMDYPLVSNKAIQEELGKDLHMEYVCAYCLSDTKDVGQRWKITKYHFFDFSIKNRVLYRAVRKLFYLASELVYLLGIRRSITLDSPNELGEPYKFYYSSEFLALSAGAARKVLDEFKKNRELRKHLKYDMVSSEIFVATILANSCFRDRISYMYNDQSTELLVLSRLSYFEYPKTGIVVFRESDYTKLIRSGFLFARKLNSGVSGRLMEMIDDNRNQNG